MLKILMCLLCISSLSYGGPYLKLGTEFGAGYRRHDHHHGLDLSVNATTVLFLENWFSAKALYLHYPKPCLYWGIGAGVTHQVGIVLMGGPMVGKGWVHHTYPTLEAACGYEFFSRNHLRLFLQLEGSVALSKYAVAPILPALVFGVGF